MKELVNDKNRRSLLVAVSTSGESGRGGVIAEGYRGIPIRKGERYDLSVFRQGGEYGAPYHPGGLGGLDG